MHLDYYIREFQCNSIIFRELFSSASDELKQWRLDDAHWSFQIVLCHLLDEEREDFRARFQLIFEDPQSDFVSIAPQEWVTARDYVNKDYGETLEAFINERKKSVEYLKSLDAGDARWKNIKEHPHLGKLSPAFFLSNWLAHDYLHIRQLTRIRYDYLARVSGTDIGYAGQWK